jgi:hypothetical protein
MSIENRITCEPDIQCLIQSVDDVVLGFTMLTNMAIKNIAGQSVATILLG